MAAIKFGTDGWRAVISDEFTFENVRIVAQAIADYLLQTKRGKPILIGYDARFLSDKYAEECARVMAANGIKVIMADKVTATPVISYGVKKLDAAGAIIVTASHNPAEYNGIKFKAWYGGSALPDIMDDIEKNLLQNPVKMMTLNEAKDNGLFEYYSFDNSYLYHLKGLIDLDLIAKSGITAVIDPMFGAGRGYLKEILSEVGLEVIEIRGEHNPSFGGINPEPIEKNLNVLKEEVKRSGALLGLATDGDADRIGAINADGSFINSHQIYALFLRHLVEKRGWSGGIVKTFSTSQMIDKLAEKYALKTFETPIGFKYICELFLTEDILLGGEESGGIGFKNHVPERDGLLSSLLLLEIAATYNKSIGAIVQDLMQDIGYHYYDRVDLHITTQQKERVMAGLSERPPVVFCNSPVQEIRTLDGVKLIFENNNWVLFRPSGTEPIVRVYAEADSSEKVQNYLSEGQNLVMNY